MSCDWSLFDLSANETDHADRLRRPGAPRRKVIAIACAKTFVDSMVSFVAWSPKRITHQARRIPRAMLSLCRHSTAMEGSREFPASHSGLHSLREQPTPPDGSRPCA